MPDEDELDHLPSAAPAAYADPDSDLDSDLDSQTPPQPKSPSHPPLPRLTTTTSGSPVRSFTQTSPPKGQGLQSPIGFQVGSPPPGSLTNDERQLISHPQTPPNNRNRYGLHYQHGSRSPSPSPSPSSRHLPPPAAASTLYHLVGGLGLGPSSPLSPFRRQFSAPLQAVRSSSRAPSFNFVSIAGSRPSTSYGNGTGSGSGTFFTHVNDSRGTVHCLAAKGDDDHTNHSHHADDELSDEEEHPQVRVGTATATRKTGKDENLTQDSKDVLVERLTDLIHHLQTKEPTVTNQSVLSDGSISELHAKVDEMEAVITGKPTTAKASKMTKRHAGSSARMSRKRQDESEVESGSESESEDEEQQSHSPLSDVLAFASSAAAAAAPGWLARSFSGSEPSPPESRSESPSPASRMHLKLAEAAEIQPSAVGDTGGMAAAAVSVAEVEVVQAQQPRDLETERIAAEAEKLAAQLETVLKSLETRREESNHVHALLVERAEAAAFRIVELEKEVVDLEEEISCQESELKHLRLELRAIETLVNEFLPPVEAADPELVRSIENWKADWKRLREKMAKSRQKKGRQSQKQVEEKNSDGHQEHEEGLRRNGTQKKHEHRSGHQHQHEHGHGHQHEFHEAKEAHHERHETHNLSVVVEVTEESSRNGRQEQQGHHHHHQPQNGNGVFGADGQAYQPAHAVRVSRTGA